jgi:VWFA-related protein
MVRRGRFWPGMLAAGLSLTPGGSGPVGAQERPAGEPPVFAVQTATVVVDVVVRDRKGRLVRDLTASDFEVYEDGDRQTIGSFRVVDNPAPGSGAAAAPAPQPEAPAASPGAPAANAAPESSPCVLAFVFDRLTPNARKVAEKAALTYTDKGYVAGDLVGVFTIDLALRTLQPFTNDVEKIQQALRQAGSQANTSFASDRDEARRRTEAIMRADDTLAGLGGQGSSAAGEAAMVASQQAFDQLQTNMLRTFDTLERDQQGMATTHGLLAVVNGLRVIPGRKTVVFFSEGLALPASVLPQFRTVIASANRANVSVYAIDAGGLRTESGTKEARDELVQQSQARLRQVEAGGATMATTRGAMNKGLEHAEDMLRQNPESGLGQLAQATGGFLVRDTNDAREGFSRITEDMRFHYVLNYSPTDDRFDGRFRTIAVKVRRPGMEVQSRKGYYAVRPEYVLPVRSYEAPALAHLDRSPRPSAFPVHMAALSFPEPEGPGIAPVLVSLPGTAVAWAPDGKGGQRTDFTVVVRVKDERGREADRLSQQYLLNVSSAKLEAARRGDILFYREALLVPGRYTTEAVVYDAIAGTASVCTSPLEVPRAEAGAVRLSSLMLVQRVEKLTPSEQGGKNPLHYGEAMLYPSMGEPFRKSATPAVGFYFTVQGTKDAPAAGKAVIELRQGQRTLASLPAELPAPDAAGRTQYAGSLPLKSLPPGQFTLRVSVASGASTGIREAPFTVAE